MEEGIQLDNGNPKAPSGGDCMKPRVLMIVLPYMQTDPSPSSKMRSWLALPYGALSVATYCKDVADITFIDCNVEDNYLGAIIKAIGKGFPEVIAFSMTFDNSFPHLKSILAQDFIPYQSLVVVGGAATLPVYREILTELPRIDAVCYGDGEVAFKNIFVSEEPMTASWVTRKSLALGIFPEKIPVPHLDDVIELDYSFVDVDNYSLQEEFAPIKVKDPKRFYMVTSRGCPFRCSFCYKSRENNRKMQYASVDKVIDHAKYLVDTHGMNILTFCDDQILFHMKRAKEIFRRLADLKIGMEVYQGVSVAFIDEEMAELMAAAGMKRAMLNIESGSRGMLTRIIDKPVDLDHAKKVIKLLRKNNIWATAIFVMGFPGETDVHRAETLKWIREADLDWCVFNPAIPIWGTKLYDICIDSGYIRKDIRLGELDYGNYTIEVPGYPAKYVSEQIYRMNLQCNFVENYQMRSGQYSMAASVFSQLVEMHPDHAFAHYYLAACFREMGNHEEALHHLTAFHDICDKDFRWEDYAMVFEIGRYSNDIF
jgi:anaerobic magnesium-protoporphyrin IX monomethyl ester cyclase